MSLIYERCILFSIIRSNDAIKFHSRRSSASIAKSSLHHYTNAMLAFLVDERLPTPVACDVIVVDILPRIMSLMMICMNIIVSFLINVFNANSSRR